MELIAFMFENLLSPALLFFILGILAATIKSDIAIPESMSRFMSMYLMLAIGFSGGSSLITSASFTWHLSAVLCVAVLLAFLLPFLGYRLLRLTTSLDHITAAAVAAHYGSISIITFMVGMAFLERQGVSFAGYIVAIMALMEIPAIFSGLWLASKDRSVCIGHGRSREIVRSGAVILLLGAFCIGLVTGKQGMEKLAGFVTTPFHGILCFFLLEMGLSVGKNLNKLFNFTWSIALFGIYMPLISATVALFVGKVLGLDLGTLFLFMTLSASASYIAVPAAMRLALPTAEAAIYVPLSLAITFPFNVTIGIPIYFTLLTQVVG